MASEARYPSGPLLITGGAGGIGEAVAALAAEAGIPVALLDVDGDKVTATAGELRERVEADGAAVEGIPCDVTDPAAVEAAFAEADRRLGSPAMVVTAAGIDKGGAVDAVDPEIWDEVHATNLRGTFLTCQAAIRRMLGGSGGAIVCVSSPLALVATPGSSAYGASKAGVSALVRSLAIDYAGRGIRVNAVLPGPTETELMWANVGDDQVERMRDVIGSEVPLGRLAAPAEIGRAALWLLSEDASYVTGAQVPCDGGALAKASVSV